MDKDGKTWRPVLNFSSPAQSSNPPSELSLNSVQLQRDDGYQEQWVPPGQSSAPTPAEPSKSVVHGMDAKTAQSSAKPQCTAALRPAYRPISLNQVVMRLQNSAASDGSAPQGIKRKRINPPSLSLGEISRANKRVKYVDSLPPALKNKKLAFASQRFGAGSNGVVCGLSVDGQVSEKYVVKTALMQVDRPSEATIEMLRKEIGLNQALSQINSRTPIPGILVGAGSVDLENQLSLILPRVHGGALTTYIDAVYDNFLSGKTAPADFTQSLRKQIKPVIEGMSVLHSNGFVVNDFNAGNLLHDNTVGHGKLIDFGCAGHIGDFIKPGTVGTIAPERIESSEHASERPGSRNKPLMPTSDAYSMGCVLHFLVHGRYPTWSDKAAMLGDEQQLHELSASTEDFLRRGSLFPSRQIALNSDLRGDDPAVEMQLREHLDASGFYELVEGLTHPDPEKRLTLTQALASPFLTGQSDSEDDF
jgi:hypothetical protein